MYFRETGNRPQKNIFDAGLLGACDGNTISIAAQSGGNPKDMYVRNGRRFMRSGASGRRKSAMAIPLSADKFSCCFAYLGQRPPRSGLCWRESVETLMIASKN